MKRYNLHIRHSRFDDEDDEIVEVLNKNGDWCKWKDVIQLRTQYNRLLRKYEESKRDRDTTSNKG